MVKKLSEETAEAVAGIDAEIAAGEGKRASARKREPRASKKYLGLPDMLARYPVDKTTIGRWVEAGDLPVPLKYGGRVMWDEAALDERDAQKARAEEALREAKMRSRRAKKDAKQVAK